MKIILELDEATNQVSIKNEGKVRIEDALGITLTAQLAIMRDVLERSKANGATKEELQTIKEDLYDKFNAGASNILYLFAPDEELHPDLTVEAMKAAEDKYMYNQLNRKARREVDKKTHNQTKVLRFPEVNKKGE